MQRGKRTEAGRPGLQAARDRAREEIGRLPDQVQGIERAEPPYPVSLSDELSAFRDQIVKKAGR
jgi:nicotinate phosphoribosyltransferase